MKIVACSDQVGINTSYSLQMRMLMANIDAEWHYVQNGVSICNKEWNGIRTYPGYIDGNTKTKSSPNVVFDVVNREDPDLVFLYEDPQHLYKYATHHRRSGTAAICWFPWDCDEWHKTIGSLLMACEDCDYEPVVISRTSQSLCRDHGFDTQQIYNMVDPVYRPMDPTIVAEEKSTMLGNMRLPGDTKILFNVARQGRRKNVESLLAMAQSLRRRRDDFVLIIHSDTYDPIASCDLTMEIVTRDMQDYVFVPMDMRWIEGASKEDLAMSYNVCDLYVSASSGEGFGLPIAEAGACGKAFVVPDNTTGPEFSQNGKHGLLAPNSEYYRITEWLNRPIVDHHAMAEQVDYLLDRPQKVWNMGEYFRQWVNKNCSMEVVVEQFVSLMEEFVPLDCVVDV